MVLKRGAIVLILVCLLGLGACAAQAGSADRTRTNGTLEVHFLDVGQADCTLLRYNDHAILVDGGCRKTGDQVVRYLQAQDIHTLDYVICTHAHQDHAGGLAAVLQSFPVRQVLCPTNTYDSLSFQEFRRAAAAQHKPLRRPHIGEVLSLGPVRLTVLSPQKAYPVVNDTSIVLRADYGSTSFLLAADAEQQAEQDMLQGALPLSATVLKLGHHGCNSSSSAAFLQAVSPQYAVISVGKQNKYGYPDAEVISRLKTARVQIYRTDQQGNILCTSDGQHLRFFTQR